MSVLRFSFLLFFFTYFSLVGQDYGPVKMNLDGYVDDRAGVEVKKAVEPTVTKTVIKPKDVKKASRTTKKSSSTTTKKGPVKDFVPEANISGAGAQGGGMLYIIIAAVVVIVIVVVLVALKKKSSKKIVPSAPVKSLSEKIAATQAVPAEPASVLERTHVSTPQEDMQKKFAREVSIDERGRNPSGIIIDEDKYFTAGAGEFVDEDRQS